jgi:hypothetical protein
LQTPNHKKPKSLFDFWGKDDQDADVRHEHRYHEYDHLSEQTFHSVDGRELENLRHCEKQLKLLASYILELFPEEQARVDCAEMTVEVALKYLVRYREMTTGNGIERAAATLRNVKGK